jgi:hypothetical protein
LIGHYKKWNKQKNASDYTFVFPIDIIVFSLLYQEGKVILQYVESFFGNNLMHKNCEKKKKKVSTKDCPANPMLRHSETEQKKKRKH